MIRHDEFVKLQSLEVVMAQELRFDYSNAMSAVREEELANMESQVLMAKETLLLGKGAGNDF